MLLLGKKALPPSVRPARSRLQWALSPNTAARLAAPLPAPDPTPCPRLPKTLTRRGRPPRAKEDTPLRGQPPRAKGTPCPTPPT